MDLHRVAPNMKSYDSPEIVFGDANPEMITDEELRQAIDTARAKGMKPMLKPVVNSADDVWRAWIRFYRPVTDEEKAAGITGEMDPWGEEPKMREGEVKDLAKWDQWWEDFTNYIVHYAKIAEEKQVPALCLGCEMNSTEEFEEKWRRQEGPRSVSRADHVRREPRQRGQGEVVRRLGFHQHQRILSDPRAGWADCGDAGG